RSRHVPDDGVGFMVWQPCGLSAFGGLPVVDGGESYWHARTDGEDRMVMLETEFLPLLEREFGLGGAGRVIAGWSMGGYGALLAAGRDPGGWSGVAVASPAVWPTFAPAGSPRRCRARAPTGPTAATTSACGGWSRRRRPPSSFRRFSASRRCARRASRR